MNKKKRIQTLILIIAGITLIGISGYKICNILLGLHNAKALYKNTQENYATVNDAMNFDSVVIIGGKTETYGAKDKDSGINGQEIIGNNTNGVETGQT